MNEDTFLIAKVAWKIKNLYKNTFFFISQIKNIKRTVVLCSIRELIVR